jgi:D-alanine-D-alanine ligase
MRRKLNITVLVDGVEIPAGDPDFSHPADSCGTEYHVITALRELGHNVSVVGTGENTRVMVDTLTDREPDIVFNLTEHIGGNRQQDKNIAALLEIMQIPFTGTGVNGLLLTRDKRLCKRLLSSHRIRVPGFASLPLNRTVRVSKKLHYPIIVKPALEDSSEAITNASVVANEDELKERAEFIHSRWQQPVIAEEYVEGRELYVSILGNSRLFVLPVRECIFNRRTGKGPHLATYRVKFNKQYREKWGIEFGFADLETSITKHIEHVCKRVYRALQIRDYGRIDLRLTEENQVIILEANANPDLAYGEEIAEAAEKAGIPYVAFINRILKTALRRYRC